jgi:hypothetical protein
MSEIYKGYELNDKGDVNWADRELALHKQLIDEKISNVTGDSVVTSVEIVSVVPDVGSRVSGRLYIVAV